jgi:deoxyribodipyrimidine photo-lyase
MPVTIYWFRNDLRLLDNPAFIEACEKSEHLLPVYIDQKTNDEQTVWNFLRVGEHRKQFVKESLEDLRGQLQELGSNLLELTGNPEEVFLKLRDQFQSNVIYCEQIEAPEEMKQVLKLKDRGFEVRQYWQSSMIDLKDLPFELSGLPDVFTQFRQEIERKKISFTKPVEVPKRIPALPLEKLDISKQLSYSMRVEGALFKGGASSASTHLSQYFDRRLPDTYKQTRNQLIGMDYSSKFSPWLAQGSISTRVIANQLKEYELRYGANEGTYWLWFELLWRDYFRFLHFKYGKRLYFPKGLSDKDLNRFDEQQFQAWSSGQTGEALIDAGMRELSETGFLSNRMRQVVASYWIYDMKGDWRAGAAWFESQLIDYDVYSNQGNWLYIAGRGNDPRGGRRFNVTKQTQDHDPNGVYRRKWLSD